MERKGWALLAIAAGGEKGVTPVILQKSLFLLGENCQEVGPDFYGFAPYDYGPFDVTVYHDAEELVEEGLVVRRPVPGHRWRDYCVTSEGARKAEELRQQEPQRATRYLQSLVTWAQGLTFSQLVSAVYRKYPEMAANSVFRK